MSRRGVKRTHANQTKELSSSTLFLNQLHSLCTPLCVKWVYEVTHACCVITPVTAFWTYCDQQYLLTTGLTSLDSLLFRILSEAGFTEGEGAKTFHRWVSPDQVIYTVPLF